MRFFYGRLNRVFLSAILISLFTFVFFNGTARAGGVIYDDFSGSAWTDKWTSFVNGVPGNAGHFTESGGKLNFSSTDASNAVTQSLIATKVGFSSQFNAGLTFSDVSITGLLSMPTLNNVPILAFFISNGVNDRFSLVMGQYQVSASTYLSFVWAGHYLDGALVDSKQYNFGKFVDDGSLGFYYNNGILGAYYNETVDAIAGDAGWNNLMEISTAKWDVKPLLLGIAGANSGNTGGTFSFNVDDVRYRTYSSVPEPASMLLLGLGVLGLVGAGRKLKK